MGKTFDDIKHSINANLDHELDYADDRNELVKSLLHSNEDWMIDLLSQEEVRGKQVKSKKDFLAEDSKLDKTLEQIADYILFPKFDDDEQYAEFLAMKNREEELNEYKREIKKLKKDNQTAEVVDKLDDIRHEIEEVHKKFDQYKKDYLSESMKKKNRFREQLEGFMDQIEELHDLIVSSDPKTGKKQRYTHKIEIDSTYWDRMRFSKSDGDFRQDILNTYEGAIEILKHQLGLDIEDRLQREQYTDNLIEYFDKNKLVFHFDNKTKVMEGQERYYKLRKMYGELVSDYEKTKEILTVPISFQSPTLPTTVFNWDTDTWYEDENGDIVEVSNNLIQFSDPNTYKGLITTYYDLKDKYENNFTNNMWAILHLFEDIVNATELSDEERLVVGMLMTDSSRQDIIIEYLTVFNKELSDKVLSTWINKTIPSKFVRTYLDSVDDWVYTYKLYGQYKQCSSCGKVKLISNDRYFRKRSDLKGDGYYNQCRKCEK